MKKSTFLKSVAILLAVTCFFLFVEPIQAQNATDGWEVEKIEIEEDHTLTYVSIGIAAALLVATIVYLALPKRGNRPVDEEEEKDVKKDNTINDIIFPYQQKDTTKTEKDTTNSKNKKLMDAVESIYMLNYNSN